MSAGLFDFPLAPSPRLADRAFLYSHVAFFPVYKHPCVSLFSKIPVGLALKVYPSGPIELPL